MAKSRIAAHAEEQSHPEPVCGACSMALSFGKDRTSRDTLKVSVLRANSTHRLKSKGNLIK
jgi:hypothetical protein